jgi:hypothetical protein
VLTKVSLVDIGEPVPDWPPADAPTCCRCGAELEYCHLMHIHEQVPGVTGRASLHRSHYLSVPDSIGRTVISPDKNVVRVRCLFRGPLFV